jgi:hypothetical protein
MQFCNMPDENSPDMEPPTLVPPLRGRFDGNQVAISWDAGAHAKGAGKRRMSSWARRREAMAGLPAGDGKPVAVLSHELQLTVLEAARKIDLFLRIDAEKSTLQHVSVNGATHQQTGLDLLGLTNQAAA